MNFLGDIFNVLLLAPTINLIVGILHLLEAVHAPGALGLAIILLTVLVKFVTWPMYMAQMKSAKKMADLQPHLAKLKEKHKGDKMAYGQAQMALFKEHNYNPAAGCLPSLLQLALIIPLYQVIQAFVDPQHGLEKVNHFLYPFFPHLQSLPDPNFLGFNLASKPSEALNFSQGLNPMMLAILLVPIVTAFIQFVLAKMMSPQPLKVNKDDSKKEVKEKENQEEMMVAMQSQMLYMMPVFIGIFSYQFPIGLSLYYNVSNIFGIWQQYLITGWGSLGMLVARFTSKKTETSQLMAPKPQLPPPAKGRKR